MLPLDQYVLRTYWNTFSAPARTMKKGMGRIVIAELTLSKGPLKTKTDKICGAFKVVKVVVEFVLLPVCDD